MNEPTNGKNSRSLYFLIVMHYHVERLMVEK